MQGPFPPFTRWKPKAGPSGFLGGPSLLFYFSGTGKKQLPRKIISFGREIREAGILKFHHGSTYYQIRADIRHKQASVNSDFTDESWWPHATLLSQGHQPSAVRIGSGGDSRRKKV